MKYPALIARLTSHRRTAGARLILATLLLPSLLAAPPVSALSATGDAPAPASQAKVDVNRASAAELEALPGIGPALAGRIVARREEKGAFASIAELLEVKGIGPRLLGRLEGRITIGEGKASSIERKKSPARGRGR